MCDSQNCFCAVFFVACFSTSRNIVSRRNFNWWKLIKTLRCTHLLPSFEKSGRENLGTSCRWQVIGTFIIFVVGTLRPSCAGLSLAKKTCGDRRRHLCETSRLLLRVKFIAEICCRFGVGGGQKRQQNSKSFRAASECSLNRVWVCPH